MSDGIDTTARIQPKLDPDFRSAAIWNREFRRAVGQQAESEELALVLERGNGSVSVHRTRILPHQGEERALNRRYVERLLKFLLWQKSGYRIQVAGHEDILEHIRSHYSPQGVRAFDYNFLGQDVYDRPMLVERIAHDAVPQESLAEAPLGRHLDGYRIGFDLGGSDRKCAAVARGKVVHSEEIEWDPYFNDDPEWHYQEINDSLHRAAAHLPQVDAIGGSAAGVYVDNEVRVASLFRGVSPEGFEKSVRGMFFRLQAAWGGIPFEVVNDGKVTALAGSMAVGDNAVLGVAMGTSLAAGYVTPTGHINDWLDELAFAPLDYNPGAPADEWSGDRGVGARYLSQQCLRHLAPRAGIDFADDMLLPQRLVELQALMDGDDQRARNIYETVGAYFGHAVAHYAEFYTLKNVLVLGRIMTGSGGDVILSVANKVLATDFPEVNERIDLVTLSETDKRHGQAVAAASLPALARQAVDRLMP